MPPNQQRQSTEGSVPDQQTEKQTWTHTDTQRPWNISVHTMWLNINTVITVPIVLKSSCPELAEKEIRE